MEKSMKNFLSFILMGMVMVGCASMTGYKPVVNEKADKNAANINVDIEYCGDLAMKTAGYGGNTLTDTLAMGAYGAGMGGILGATVTSPAGPAALAGLGVGGLTGMFYGLYESDETFKRAYKTCMQQLNHPVLW